MNVAKALVAGKHASTHSLLGQKVPLRVETRGGGMFTGGGLISPSHPSKPQNAVIVGLMGSGVGYVPYDTALHWTAIAAPNPHHIHYPGVTVLARNVSNVSPVTHHIDALGFNTTTAQQTLKSVNKSFGLIETGLGTVGGIALVVAGLMIGVVMSMAVLERRREIGIFRAIGARRRDISRLFLLESVSIGLMGGIVGDLMGTSVGTSSQCGHEPFRVCPVGHIRSPLMVSRFGLGVWCGGLDGRRDYSGFAGGVFESD